MGQLEGCSDVIQPSLTVEVTLCPFEEVCSPQH